MKLVIDTSKRHSKILRDFAEKLALYWLSKYGFECAPADHTGIDIVATNPHTKEIMGISVRSRCRRDGREEEYMQIPNDSFDKAAAACQASGCKPYFAIVVDAGGKIRVFVLSMDYLLRFSPKRKFGVGWRMTEECIDRYAQDNEIMSFELAAKTTRWWTTE